MIEEIMKGQVGVWNEKDVIVEGICVDIKYPREKDAPIRYSFICCYQTADVFFMTTKELRELKDFRVVENLHFFTLEELTEALTSMFNEVILLGTRKNTYCSTDSVFLKHGNKILKILIPNVRFNRDNKLDYLFVQFVDPTEYALWRAGNDALWFVKIDEPIKPEALNQKVFSEFVGNDFSEFTSIQPYDVYGVKIGKWHVICDFKEPDHARIFGSGLKEKP